MKQRKRKKQPRFRRLNRQEAQNAESASPDSSSEQGSRDGAQSGDSLKTFAEQRYEFGKKLTQRTEDEDKRCKSCCSIASLDEYAAKRSPTSTERDYSTTVCTTVCI